jgi:uncharacterized RDD family membrane protein YckC
MTALRRAAIALLVVPSVVALRADLLAQRSTDPSRVERTEQSPDDSTPPVDQEDVPVVGPHSSPVFRLGGDYTLGPADEAPGVIIVRGQAQISGHVNEDLFVFFGDTRINETATIDGSVIIVGGSVSVATGATVRRGFAAFGGVVNEGAGFAPGQEYIVIDPRAIGIDSAALGGWITGGLLLGRPLVPSQPWVWMVAGMFFLVHLIILLVAERPVRRCTQTVVARPLTTFLIGLLVLLLAGPIALLLIVSIAGLVVLPFALCGLIAAWMVGKVAVIRWIGGRAVPEPLEGESASRVGAVRSFLIGAAVLVLAYLVPVLGFIVWGATGVLALGAAVLTVFEGYRRENPSFPRAPTPRAVPVVPEPMPIPTPVLRAAESFAPPAPAVSDAVLPQSSVLASSEVTLARATFRERLAAFALDVAVVLITGLVLDLFEIRAVRNFILLLLLYHVAFWSTKGTTIGGIICQLRLVRADGQPLQLGDAFIRGLAGILSGVVAGLGFLWMLKKPEYETWHDKIAGTLVVKVPRQL